MNCVGHYLAISTFYELPHSFLSIYTGPVEQFKNLVGSSLYCGQNLPPPPFPQVRIGLNLLAKDGWDEYQQSPHIPSGLLYIQFLLLLVHSTSNFKIQWHVEIQKTLTLRLYRVTQYLFSFMKPFFYPENA